MAKNICSSLLGKRSVPMKIDANSLGVAAVYAAQGTVNAGAAQAASVQDDAGAAFEKGRQDLFVQQLERIQDGDNQDVDVLENGSPKSKLEVLSNLVTERDMAQLQEETKDMEEEELDVIVTVVEKIKIQLAAHGNEAMADIAGDISAEKLQKAAGTASNAVDLARKLKENNLPVTEDNINGMLAALEQLQQTGLLSEDAMEYCIRTETEPTIENLYMAQHSGSKEGSGGYYAEASGYVVKAGAQGSLEELLPQMERIITQAGMQADEKTMAQARWLVERQLPLTKENLCRLQDLEQLSQDIAEGAVEEQAVDGMLDALMQGKRPAQALLSDTAVQERSTHAVEVLQNAEDEQIKAVTATGQEVTIERLEQAESAIQDGAVPVVAEDDIAYVTARRQLEEIRLMMTIESTQIMIKSGVSVETESLQNLIDRLKQIEDAYYARLLAGGHIEPSMQNISLYREIAQVQQGIAASPAELIGTMAYSEVRLTVQAVYTQGSVLQEQYKQAEQAYETVMTRPRSDMGDSIQKAFRNVDDILKEMNLEVTQANQRAVRILGYNSMEITPENISRVKAADLEVNTMLENMKPSVVLDMIREGYNPLDQTVQEVNDKIASMQEESQLSKEQYSEFLWNLEHSDGIDQQERSAYIGLYRLMHQVEQSDGAVIGALVEQGASLTLRNLMTGLRSGRHTGMDYKIGEIEGVEGNMTGSITEQIEEGYRYVNQLVENIQERMAKADYSQMQQPWEMSLEEFSEYVAQNQSQDNSYAAQQLRALEQASQAPEAVVEWLQSRGEAVTIGNILAAQGLLKGRGGMFTGLLEEETSEAGNTELASQAEALSEAFSDDETAKEAYQRFMDTADQTVEHAVEDTQVTYEQMRSWKLLSSQISMASRAGEKEDYYIPAEIGGEWTSIHVQFVHDRQNMGRVALSMDNEQTGKIAAEFAAGEKGLEGYVMAERGQIRKSFLAQSDSLKQRISAAAGMEVVKLDYAQYEQLDVDDFSAEFAQKGEAGSVSGQSLYQVAKELLTFIKTSL